MKNLFLFIMIFLSSLQAFTQSSIKITTWNIQMLPKIINSSYEIRAKLIADYMISNNSDVFIIQEAFISSARNVINEKLGKIYPYQIPPIKKNKKSLKINCGLWILSKYPIVEYDFQKFSTCVGYDYLSQKGVLYVKIKVNNTIIQLFDTHLNSGNDRQETRDIQYKEFKNFIDKHANNDYIQIIGGDLNTPKSNKVIYNKMIKELGVKDYDCNELTYDAQHNDMNDEFIVDIIDYLFLNNSSLKLKENRHVETPISQWSEDHKDLSDHYPLILNLLSQ